MSNTSEITLAASQAPAVQKPKPTFKDLLAGDKFQTQLAAALPKHLTPDRFTRILLTATMKVPKLLECSQESLFKGILDAAAAGVEIDGRRAHLIPYGNVATLIIDYKGVAELIMRSGLVSSIHADVVCDKDVFEADRGQVTKHTINLREDRGAMYAAYCIITMKDGSAKCDVMSKGEIDAIRKRSKSGGSGPWMTDYNEMAKKTVFRRASKWVPLSPEIRGVVENESDAIEVEVVPKRGLMSLIGSSEPMAETETVAPVAEAAATETVGEKGGAK